MKLLEVSNLHVSFGGLQAVKGLSFDVEEGEIISLVGPNGSGKTTTLNAVTGYYCPTSGDVRWKDSSIVGLSPPSIARLGIVRTFQKTALFTGLTVFDNVLAGCHLHCQSNLLDIIWKSKTFRIQETEIRERARKVLEFVGLRDKEDLHVESLAYGQQRLLEIGISLAAEPQMLMLDEPAGGMNPIEAKVVMDILLGIRKDGLTILLVEHNMKVVMEISDRIIVIEQGQKIADGSPTQVRNDPAVIEAYLGKGEIYARKPGP